MFVNVGRFQFRPMTSEEWQRLLQGIERDLAPLARESSGFRSVYFARSGEEMLAVWLWDSADDWHAGLARFGPYLQQQVLPNLAQPPDRVGAEVAVQIAA